MRRNDIINELVARGFSAEAQESIKNGVVYEGIVIRNDDVIAPIIYTQRLIEDAEAQGKSLADVVADVIRVYEEHKNVNLDVKKLTSREYIMANIFVAVQKASDQQLIKKSTNLEGIEAILYVRGDEVGDAQFSMKVPESVLNHAGITVEEAWAKAEANTFAETEIKSMAHMMSELTEMPYDPDMETEVPMHVISNKCRFRGASAILDKAALKKFAEEHGVDMLVIIPSSIHEMLIIPYDGTIDMNEMSAMVKEVNATNVEPEEQLSDIAYLVTV